MNAGPMINSAALYFAPREYGAIPLNWLERAREFFLQHDLVPILFTAYGGDFLLDDCYVLEGHGGDLAMFGEIIQARGSALIDALRFEKIEDLGLDSPRPEAEDREDWRANVSVFSGRGECYIGVDDELVPDLVIGTSLVRPGEGSLRHSLRDCVQVATITVPGRLCKRLYKNVVFGGPRNDSAQTRMGSPEKNSRRTVERRTKRAKPAPIRPVPWGLSC